MKTAIAAGVVLGVLCTVWMFVCGFAGWYKDPVRYMLFYLVVPIEVTVLILGLRHTAREGRGYLGQVGAGFLMSFIGGLIIVGSSLLFSTVVFPEATREVMDMREEIFRQSSPPGAVTDSLLAVARAGASPVNEAVAGFMGTLGTGVLASLIIAIFVRAKRVPGG